ncbi:MAG: hypothetical protein AAFS11_08660 [Planctomycetota bacterium]
MNLAMGRRGSIEQVASLNPEQYTVIPQPQAMLHAARMNRRGELVLDDYLIGAKFWLAMPVLVPLLAVPTAAWAFPYPSGFQVWGAVIICIIVGLCLGTLWLFQNFSKRRWTVNPSRSDVGVKATLDFVVKHSSFSLSDISLMHVNLSDDCPGTKGVTGVFLGAEGTHPELWLFVGTEPIDGQTIPPGLQDWLNDLLGMRRRARDKSIERLEHLLGRALPVVQQEQRVVFELMPRGWIGIVVLAIRALRSTIR